MSDEDKYWRIAPTGEPPVSRHNWSKPSATADDARADLAFQDPDWSLGNILSWIAFRECERICEFRDRRDLLAHRRQPSMGMPFAKGGDKADRLLLYALKEGRLTAGKDSEPIPSHRWSGKFTSDLSGNLRFQRIEALKCWPEVNGYVAQEAAARPGPKPGEKSGKQRAWEIAELILKSAEAPPKGHGRLSTLARLVTRELSLDGRKYEADSIRKLIGSSLREWEGKTPNK